MPRIRYYCIYPVSEKKKAKRLMQKGYSERRVKQKLDLKCSRSTIGRWRYQRFDAKSIKDRESKKVIFIYKIATDVWFLFINHQIHSLLTPHEAKVFAGWIVYRNLKRKNTATQDLETFLRLKFGLYPSKSWYTQFCKKNHLSYRITAVAKWSEKSHSKWKEAIDYISRIRNDIKLLRLPLNKVACFDKTKFRLFTVGVKQVGIRGGCVLHLFYLFHLFPTTLIVFSFSSGQPRRFRCNDIGKALTVYSTLVADGTIGPLYIETNKPFDSEILERLPPETYAEYIPPKTVRRGERGTIAYLEKSFSNRTYVKKDMVLSDNEASFKTELVRDLEHSHGMSH